MREDFGAHRAHPEDIRRSGVREELLAAVDLTTRGYDVFTPIVGYPGRCDLVAIHRQTLRVIRVEVKTCGGRYLRADGSGLAYSNTPHPLKRHFYDVVAYVLKSERDAIAYEPPLDSLGAADAA